MCKDGYCSIASKTENNENNLICNLSIQAMMN